MLGRPMSLSTRRTRFTVPEPAAPPFVFVGGRLWLDFVNTEDVARDRRVDALVDFDAYIDWLHAASVLDAERTAGIRRRALQQPTGASAALVDARRVRDSLRGLAEVGAQSSVVRSSTLAEINRVLGRSAGTRRVEPRDDGGYARAFVPVGDAFAGLLMPIVESAADALILAELLRVHRCASPRCTRVFHDATKNGARRWCDMATCGNRAKVARFRSRQR